ncbi:MAG: hypothetical protein GX568_06955 [Candidatus Gastranaerophilales bacterium]|nr:hypothetical protein [Candidatus Gastranaerophilales bacterium]
MATFYYKKESDTYHWHFKCSKIPCDVRNNPNWVIASTKPPGKEQCNECKTLD